MFVKDCIMNNKKINYRMVSGLSIDKLEFFLKLTPQSLYVHVLQKNRAITSDIFVKYGRNLMWYLKSYHLVH